MVKKADDKTVAKVQPNTNFVPGIIFGSLAIIVIAIALILNGRKSPSPTPSPDIEPTVIVGIDRSGSTDPQRPAQRIAAEAATFFADENRTIIGFYAVDQKAVPIQEPSESLGAGLSDSVLAEFKTKKQSRSVGTRPLAFWREMKERFVDTKSPTYIAFLTDGGNDYATDGGEITSTLQSLAENPNIHVAILGVASDLAISIRRDIAPFGTRATHSIQNSSSSKEALQSDLMAFLGGLE